MKKVVLALVALLLWLVTAALSVAGIVMMIDMVAMIYARYGPNPSPYTLASISKITAGIAGTLSLLFVLSSAEYHIRNFGERSSWWVFAWSMIAELVLVGIYVLSRQ